MVLWAHAAAAQGFLERISLAKRHSSNLHTSNANSARDPERCQ